MINVLVFTGGNGNKNLINHLKEISNVELFLLINGYDDGLSTGIARRALGKMLGPSDFRKNITYILNDSNKLSRKIKKLFEYRINKFDVHEILNKGASSFILTLFNNLHMNIQENNYLFQKLSTGWAMILNYTNKIEDLVDFSIGNIIISACYYDEGNFNKGLSSLLKNLEIEGNIINITDDNDNSRIIAITDNEEILFNEMDIVSYNGFTPLRDFIILDSEDLNKICKDDYSIDSLYNLQKIPKASHECINAIEIADVIIFGSGTLNSSLLPSYRILNKYIEKSKAKKYLIINNLFDNDIQNINLEEYLLKHTKEGIDINSIDSIFLDKNSFIKRDDICYKNLVIKKFRTNDGKHNPIILWNEILKNISKNTKVNIIISNNTSKSNKKKYLQNLEYLSSYYSDMIFHVHDENVKINKGEFVLILDTSGYVLIDNIILWINTYYNFSYDSIIGYRYLSRKQTLLSFKGKFKDSFFTYYISKFFSYIASFFHLIFSRQFIPDPFSGVYFFRVKNPFLFKNTGTTLRYIKKNKFKTNISLPIHFVNTNDFTFLQRVKSFISNLIYSIIS
jgi:2-phospho-L-lactate transferase/gluconeogenesis factor (CofD/UPF0052 family)